MKTQKETNKKLDIDELIEYVAKEYVTHNKYEEIRILLGQITDLRIKQRFWE